MKIKTHKIEFTFTREQSKHDLKFLRSLGTVSRDILSGVLLDVISLLQVLFLLCQFLRVQHINIYSNNIIGVCRSLENKLIDSVTIEFIKCCKYCIYHFIILIKESTLSVSRPEVIITQ